jgi:hypothetical protein
MSSRSAKDIVLASPKFMQMLSTSLLQYQDIEWDERFETDGDLRMKVLIGDHDNKIISCNKEMLEFVRCTVKVLETFSGISSLSSSLKTSRKRSHIHFHHQYSNIW